MSFSYSQLVCIWLIIIASGSVVRALTGNLSSTFPESVPRAKGSIWCLEGTPIMEQVGAGMPLISSIESCSMHWAKEMPNQKPESYGRKSLESGRRGAHCVLEPHCRSWMVSVVVLLSGLSTLAISADPLALAAPLKNRTRREHPVKDWLAHSAALTPLQPFTSATLRTSQWHLNL